MRPLLEQNHYEILEVAPGCDVRQIERAYHIARSTYAPGSVAAYSVFSDDDSKVVLDRIEQAYRVLSDPHSRAEYDRRLSEAPVPPAAPEGGAPGEAKPAENGTEGEPLSVASTRVASSEPGVTPPLRRQLDPSLLEMTEDVAPVQAALPEVGPAIEPDGGPEEFALLIESAEPSSRPDAQESLADGLEPEDGIFDGPALRRIRMSLGVELSEIADRTKISPDHLRSIEEDHFEALPAPVYVRGFVREVARFLGLDAPAVARSYYELMTATRNARR